jgi:hypothetical protein
MAASSEPQRIGKLPPAYRFFLNPYRDMRFTSGCPGCGKKLRQRKLPLAIHIDDWGMAVINKTCRYCPACDLLIAHEDELRAMIDQLVTRMESNKANPRLFVVGTLERDAWRLGVDKPLDRSEMLAALHDFIDYDNYKSAPVWVQS